LAERGAQNWTLRPQSRYLSKLDELAAGKRVESDKVRRGLVEAFGFNRDLCDTFLLYLIRGRGYRALRDSQPVTDIDYGGLAGLVLERGERLEVYEWAQVKEFIQGTWGTRAPTAELTVAAQDQLWRGLNATSRGARRELDRVRKRLAVALEMVGVSLNEAPRLAVLDAAVALNDLAMREDVDPYAGLRALLTWQPEQPGVTREAVAAQIARCLPTQTALDDLQTDTVDRIVTLAEGGNTAAQQALQEVREFLAATDEKADLTSHIVSWRKQAKEIIDTALKAVPTGLSQPEVISVDKRSRDRKVRWQVTSVQAEIGGQTVPLASEDVEPVVDQLLSRVEAVAGDQTEVIIRVACSQEKGQE